MKTLKSIALASVLASGLTGLASANTIQYVHIAGAPAYRQVSPSPISGSSSALSISTLARGYAVFLTSTGLTQSQDERALASIIGHL